MSDNDNLPWMANTNWTPKDPVQQAAETMRAELDKLPLKKRDRLLRQDLVQTSPMDCEPARSLWKKKR